MAKDWAGWMGAMVGVIGLGFAAQQYFFGTFATTKIDDVKGCNGFLIKEKPVISFKQVIPEALEKKYLQDKILSCRDELQKNDKNAVAYTNIGEAMRRLGDLPNALVAQQKARKLDPNLQEAELGLASVQANMGKIAEANKTIQDTLAQKESAIAYFYQGIAFGEQKDLKSAEASFRRVISLDPNLAGAHYNLGLALGTQGKTTDAITAYQKAISINPNFAEAYTNLGASLDDQGKIAEAITAYQKAISINPNFALTYSNLGVVLNKQGKTAEAIAAYQKAISINPNFAPTYTNLGIVLNKQGKTAEAIAAYQKAISIDPTYADAHIEWGFVLAGQGNLEGVIAKLRKARDLYRDQGNTQQVDKITQILKKLGNR